MIDEMACRRVHNGHASGYGFILTIEIDFAQKIEGNLEEQLTEWIYKSLDRAHRALDFDRAWSFVSNVRMDQWVDPCTVCEASLEHPWSSATASTSCSTCDRENSLQVCVHIDDHFRMAGPDEGLFGYSYGEPDAVCAAALLAQFDTAPESVRGLAVSGVDETQIRDEWAECITHTPNRYDRDGKGYMVHPMYTLPESCQDGTLGTWPQVCVRREMSFNFGWPEYPGGRGRDW
jgi:hypothetical protein